MRAIERVLKSQSFVLGPFVKEFEQEIAKYHNSRFAIGVSSGTDALLIALMALEIQPGDEVITTPFSFFATAGSIARLGAKPVFVDIEPDSFQIDWRKLEKARTTKTRALMPVHLYGQSANLEQIIPWAKKHSLPVVEDAAQAIGAEYRRGEKVGTVGTFGCISFFPTKNLGALGEGGLVLSNDEALAKRVEALRVHGSEVRYYHKWIGGNFRLPSIQAAALQVKLSHLNDWIAKRQSHAQLYFELFAQANLENRFGLKLPKLGAPKKEIPNFHTFNQFVIRVPRRDELKSFLAKQEIGSEVYYPLPLHLQECFRDLGYHEGDFPETEKAAKEVLALPIFPELVEEQQRRVVQAIEKFYNQ